MTEFRGDRERLLGVVEQRLSSSAQFTFQEVRASKDAPAQVIVEGYAATFDPYEVSGGPEAGGWNEQLSKRAFDQTLAEQPDLHLLVNHAGLPLARTRSGNLKLSTDNHGLRMWASLDPSDPDVQAILPKMRRGDLDEMSFAFRVNDQMWDTSYTNRTINSLSLEKGDVSIVTWGANPNTKAVIADAVGALSKLSARELVEVRELDRGQLRRAATVLAKIAGVSVVSEARSFADPGYKLDGRKRYPLDTEDLVRSAWVYFSSSENQRDYTRTQAKAIKRRISARAGELGVVLDARAVAPSDAAWAPGSVQSEDPHEQPFAVGTKTGIEGLGPVPGNIVGGNFSAQNPGFNKPAASTDPHDVSFDTEEKLSMEPHDNPLDFGAYPAGSKITPSFGDFEGEGGGGDPHQTPYDLGGQVGGVPGDRPNVDFGGAGSPAPNVVVTGAGLGGDKLPAVVAPPGVGTAPVDDGSGQAFDWTTGTLEPSDPEEELDAALRAMEAACDPHEQPTLGGGAGKFSPGSWEPTNIEGGSVKHPDSDEGVEELKLDLGMAEALDRTIIHAYKLSEGSAEVRKVLAVARKQLIALTRTQAAVAPGGVAPMSDIQRRMAELKAEVGDVSTGKVSDYLKALRSEGTAPVGYRGLLDHDPHLHITSPAERLAAEAKEKLERARVAAAESDTASERLKKARREAELNDAIRRNRKAGR